MKRQFLLEIGTNLKGDFRSWKGRRTEEREHNNRNETNMASMRSWVMQLLIWDFV
jgi:hypothetical protein